MLQFGCDVVQNTGKEVYCARLFALGWIKEDDHQFIWGVAATAQLLEETLWVDVNFTSTLVDGLVPAGWGRLILMYVQSVNIGIHSAWRKASDRTFRWRIVDMATLRHRSRTQPLKKKLSGVKYCESVRLSVCLFARVSQNRISGPTRNITCLLHEDMAVTRTSSDYSAAC